MVGSLGASGETIVRRSERKDGSVFGSSSGAHEFELTNKAADVPS